MTLDHRPSPPGAAGALTGSAARAAWAKTRGYRRDGFPCPRRIIGWSCLMEAGPRGESVRCVCEPWSHLLSHGEAWRTGDGGLLVTGEPYHVPVDDPAVSAFRAALAPYGLAVSASADSPHAPGLTTLITVGLADRPQRTDEHGREVLTGYRDMRHGIPLRLMVWCRWCCRWHQHGADDSTVPGIRVHWPEQCDLASRGGPYEGRGYVIEVSEAPYAAVRHLPREINARQVDALLHLLWGSPRARVPDSLVRLRAQPYPVPGGPAATYGGAARELARQRKAADIGTMCR